MVDVDTTSMEIPRAEGRRAQLEQALLSLRAADAPSSLIQATEKELASLPSTSAKVVGGPLRDVGKLHIELAELTRKHTRKEKAKEDSVTALQDQIDALQAKMKEVEASWEQEVEVHRTLVGQIKDGIRQLQTHEDNAGTFAVVPDATPQHPTKAQVLSETLLASHHTLPAELQEHADVLRKYSRWVVESVSAETAIASGSISESAPLAAAQTPWN